MENLMKIINKKEKGGGNDLPKFKFPVEFPIGLHVILQLQIKKKKNQNCLLS